MQGSVIGWTDLSLLQDFQKHQFDLWLVRSIRLYPFKKSRNATNVAFSLHCISAHLSTGHQLTPVRSLTFLLVISPCGGPDTR